MDTTTITVTVIFALIIVAVLIVFRHKIKIALKGPGEMGLEVEASNNPPGHDNTQPGETSISTQRNVSIGGDVRDSTIVTGDQNMVQLGKPNELDEK